LKVFIPRALEFKFIFKARFGILERKVIGFDTFLDVSLDSGLLLLPIFLELLLKLTDSR